MTITISIPPTLQRFSAGQAEVTMKAARLDHALATLLALYPDLGSQAFTSEGRARPFLRVFLNDQDCTRNAEPARSLTTGDRITLISAFAGG